jgi:hypothetical protein
MQGAFLTPQYAEEEKMVRKEIGCSIIGAAFATVATFAIAGGASASDADAKNLLKGMSDYLAAQSAVSFGYDTNLEVVTKDQQKLLLASSGTINLVRPDKLRATRSGGFANVELIFDGKTLTLVSKDANRYSQVEAPGSLDHLVDELRDKLHKPLPGADLLLSNVYDVLMDDVTDVKDLGSGVIDGAECNHLAFRKDDVDWQIWIAQGANPYPCRYVITSKGVDQAPQYSVQVRDWKAGSDVAADDFGFMNGANAAKVEPSELTDVDELPTLFAMGDTK